MRPDKDSLKDYVAGVVKESDYMFFVSYKGMKVAELNEFRKQLREVKATCQVLKNTYLLLGLRDNEVKVPQEFALSGDTAVVFGQRDAAGAAKVIRDYAKSNDKVQFKGGLVDGSMLSPAAAKTVADLPPKEVLQAMLLGVLQAPMGNLVRVLNGKLSSVVYVLQAFRDAKEKQQ
jgi:large subunit ribosomal protein L10